MNQYTIRFVRPTNRVCVPSRTTVSSTRPLSKTHPWLSSGGQCSRCTPDSPASSAWIPNTSSSIGSVRSGRLASNVASRCGHLRRGSVRPAVIRELSDINFEVQHCVSSRITFLRSPIAQPLPRPAVEFRSDPIAIVLGEVGHALSFGQILPDQAVGVFVGAALPRVMRGGEVEAGGGGPLELGVVVKLCPIIDGDGLHGMGLRGDQLLHAVIHRGTGALT